MGLALALFFKPRRIRRLKLAISSGIRQQLVYYYLILAVILLFIDPKDFLVIVVAELGVLMAFYYFFGDRRRASLEEILNLDEVASKFGHLVIHSFKVRLPITRRQPESSLYFVENTMTGCAYYCPDYVKNVAKAVPRKQHLSEDEMDADFVSRHITILEREPTFLELRAQFKPAVEPSL